MTGTPGCAARSAAAMRAGRRDGSSGRRAARAARRPSCRRAGPPRRRPRSGRGGSRPSPSVDPLDQRVEGRGVAVDQRAAPAPGRGCRGRRSCRWRRSRARRRSRSAATSGGSAARTCAHRLVDRRQRLVDRLGGPQPGEVGRAWSTVESRGPSPSTKASSAPSACGTSRMSAKRIAASKPKRRIGCSVTSAASSGV